MIKISNSREELEQEMLEEEFVEKILKMFDSRYGWTDKYVTEEDILKEETNKRNWEYFKDYLHELASEMYNPEYEGLFIRALFRDFIVNNILTREE